jgi:tetratricopeptide (TPR) repeat protein
MGTLRPLKFLIVGLLGGVFAAPASPVNANSFGDYLVARAAEHDGNWNLAAAKLSAVWHETKNPDALREAFLFALGSGDMPGALALAHQIDASMPEDSLAGALLLADAVKRGDIAAAERRAYALPRHGVDTPLAALSAAWLQATQKNADPGAIADQLDGAGGLETVHTLHAAMIAEMRHDAAGATAAYSALVPSGAGAVSPRLAALVRDYDLRAGNKAAARTVMAALVAADPTDLSTASVAASTPSLIPYTYQTGIAEAYYDMAEMLLDADRPDVALFYARMAAYIQPQAGDTKYLLGEIARVEGRLTAAADLYLSVPVNSRFGMLAHIEAVNCLERANNVPRAIDEARRLIKVLPGRLETTITLADLLRRAGHYDEAAGLYTAALKLAPAHDARQAALFFARGVSYDHLKQDSAAETDLTQAVALAPNQPLILNYLGYLWADQGKNLTQAEELLQHAAALAPTDGAIADSLGWVLYRRGSFEAAVGHLEAAVAANPGDSVMNAHLGDAYWQVGRRQEAQFQWRRALINAESENAAGLKSRLKDGLAPPVSGESHAALSSGTAE